MSVAARNQFSSHAAEQDSEKKRRDDGLPDASSGYTPGSGLIRYIEFTGQISPLVRVEGARFDGHSLVESNPNGGMGRF
jgi:hypothetical protein